MDQPVETATRHWTRRRVLAASGTAVGTALTTGLAGCLDEDDDQDPATPTPVEDPEYDLSVEHPPLEDWDGYEPDWEPRTDLPAVDDVTVETVVENLAIPWDVAFAANGDFFLTERPGQLSRYEAGTLEAVTEPTDVIDHADAIDVEEDGDWWAAGGEGGLLGCAVHPNYPDVPVVYAFYTYDAGGGDLRNRLVSYDVEGDASGDAGDETVLIEDIPGADIHNGARLTFGPRNYLWVTMGDAEVAESAQDPSTLAGTICRVTPTGEPADEDPAPDLYAPDIDGADPRVYSYGHRNPQGIDFLPTGEPIVSEHGPSARDEILLPTVGDDHGWPETRGVPGDEEYDGYAERDDVANPLVSSGPGDTWAPSGAVFYTGEAVPAFRDRYLVAGLVSQQLYVVTPHPPGEAPEPDVGERYTGDWSDGRYDATAVPILHDELGRMRHVAQGPDGEIYALTSNRDGRAGDGFPREGDDRIVRLSV